MTSNVKVIIRSAGERTESLCRSLILSQGISPDKVVTVRESPFSAAMRKSFEIGLQSGLPWTFCIDADVLLRPGSIKRMIEFAEQQPEEVCEIQGYVLCKFFGGPRTAGNHLYRTSLLERVITNIPEEGIDIRPEFRALEYMKEQGYPWLTVPFLVGLHDFEQYHRDTFRKCFIQAHKHDYLADLFLTLWREGASKDTDYRVALEGFARGIQHGGPIFIDARDRTFGVNLAELGLQEKAIIDSEVWSLERIEEIIHHWHEPEIYLIKFPDRLGLGDTSASLATEAVEHSILEKLRKKYSEIGFFRLGLYAAGVALTGLAYRLFRWSSK